MEQTDTLLNGYKILQDPQKFMFGIDAVLLADFACSQIHKNDKIIDLGTGTGIIPLLLESQTQNPDSVYALEVQEESAKMAQRSIELNNLSEKIKIIQGDITQVEKSKYFDKHSFNCVTCNPPYMIVEHGKQNTLDAKTIARHEVLCTLEDVIKAADYLLKPHGKFFMIHRPFRLPEMFVLMNKYKLEPKRMRLIHSFKDDEPVMVLIEARKDAKPRLKIEKPLIVYETTGVYSKEVQNIYAATASKSK